MGRAPCCDKANVKRGPWSPEEDAMLKDYMEKHGTGGNWIALPKKAGLKRCGKSCRLRWLNYLRPNIKHGEFSEDEDRTICTLYANIGSRWSIIAAQLPGRTDNDIKNYWNTKLKKKLMGSTFTHHHSLTYPPISFQQSPSYSSYSSQSSLFPLIKCSNTSYYLNSTLGNETMPNISSSLLKFQTQDGFLGSMKIYDHQVKDVCCSSSDASNCNYHIGHGKKEGGSEYEQYNQFPLYNRVEEEKSKFMIYSNGDEERDHNILENQNGLHVETPLDYSLEEIKQLISSNYNNCPNLNNFFN